MQFDDLFEHFGEIGLYQICIFLMAISPTLVSDTISLNFLTGRMDHWCDIPELSNLTMDQQRHISSPLDSDGDYDGCLMYDLDYSSYSQEQFLNWQRVPNNTATKECPDGWNYDRSVFKETTVSAVSCVIYSSIYISL